MNSKIIVGLIVLLAGVAVGWYVLQGVQTKQEVGKKGQPIEQVSVTPGLEESPITTPGIGGPSGLEKGGVQERVVVTYTDSGFAPSPIRVKVGSIVTFVNESSGMMWVASDPHPSHTLLSGFDELTSVGKGGTYEYTFAKVGTWTYHNHVSPSVKGSVIVRQ